MASATLFQTKLALYTSYVVAGRVRDAASCPTRCFWDTADPYHYLRIEPHRDHDVVIFGGEDHKTGQADDTHECYERLEARRCGTLLPDVELTHRWSGQVIETPDGLPYIGEMADHQYAATGFSGNGMTFGTLAAMMITDAILGRTNPWADCSIRAARRSARGLWDYLKENNDYPVLHDARSLRRRRRQVAAGGEARQGKIIERDGDARSPPIATTTAP